MYSKKFEMNYVLEKKNALNYNRNTILYNRADLNKLIILGSENFNHFSTKAILFYILSELNHDLISDFKIVGVGKADLYDVSSRIVYKFEPFKLSEYHKKLDELYEQSEVEVIAINIQELPDDLFQRYLKLREYVFTD